VLASIHSLGKAALRRREHPVYQPMPGARRYHFRDDVHVEFIAQVNRIDVVALLSETTESYASKSLYMIVKNTCRNRLTAFTMTLNKYSHASPVPSAVLSIHKDVDYFDLAIPVIVDTGDHEVIEDQQERAEEALI
jgi:hypothetical protein